MIFAAEVQAPDALGDPLAHDHLVEAGREVAALDDADAAAHLERLRRDAADGDVGRLAVGACAAVLATTTISGEASGWPSASARHARVDHDQVARGRSGTPEVSSEAEPRCTTIALSGRPVARSARRNPFAIASSTTSTATTRRDADDGEQRHLPALAEVADVVGEREGHRLRPASACR